MEVEEFTAVAITKDALPQTPVATLARVAAEPLVESEGASV